MSREAIVTLFIHGSFQIGASMSALFLNHYFVAFDGRVADHMV
jgi:hypothetical protein